MNRAARFAPRGDWVLAGRLGGYYDLKYYRRCDHLVGNTRTLVRWIAAQGWPAARTHYLPNFAPDLHGAARSGSACRRAAAGAGAGPPAPQQGVRHPDPRPARLPGVHAVIAGEGPERTRCRRWRGMRRRGPGAVPRLAAGHRRPARRLRRARLPLAPRAAGQRGGGGVRRRPPGRGRRRRRPARADPARRGRPAGAGGRRGGARHLAGPGARQPAVRRGLAEAGRARYLAEFAEAPVLAQWRGFLATVEKP